MSDYYLPPEDLAKLKHPQVKALESAEDRAETITGQNLGKWHIAYQEETRPGRGHDISAWASDGEYLATQYLDPYGNGALVVSQINLLHNDIDEDHFDEYGDCEHFTEPYQANCGSWDCRAPECGRKE